jgi:hypothetical protein
MVSEQWRHEAVISFVCACLDGMELTRIQVGNRALVATRTEPDKDGIVRGLGLPPEAPLVAMIIQTRDGMEALEEVLEKELVRQVKRHPLASWIDERRGLGWKTTGRLLGTIGDPYLRSVVLEDGTWSQAPRSVGQLWAYCGMDVREGAAPVRRKGVKSNWNANARKCLYNIATAQRYGMANHYRPVYDAAKERAKESVHRFECVRCGPSGHPAAPGSPLGGMHAEARALRAISKTVLKEMWRQSRLLHGITADEDGLADRWAPGQAGRSCDAAGSDVTA